MDGRRFDALARALGGASTRRSALGALAGLLAGGAAPGIDAKKRRKRCDPECAAGQTCRQETCACDDGGAACGAGCCRTGQRCEGGACVDPAPQCVAAGEACKGMGAPCCEGTVCASGQGGQGDVACYVPAGGACLTTADCVWFAACEDGTCLDRQPTPTPPAPRCVPTFAPTADASANGAALRQAVADARSGDTIVLAEGAYQFDDAIPVTGTVGYAGLLVLNKAVTIERCDADSVVTLVCPATETPSKNVACVLSRSSGVSPTASLTLRGVSIEARKESGAVGWGVLASGGAVVLEDVAVQVAGANCLGIYGQGVDTYGTTATITIRSGVSVTSAAQSPLYYGMARFSTNASATCSAAVSFLGGFANPSKRCDGLTAPEQAACGCIV